MNINPPHSLLTVPTGPLQIPAVAFVQEQVGESPESQISVKAKLSLLAGSLRGAIAHKRVQMSWGIARFCFLW
jgi:hypothetical protein